MCLNRLFQRPASRLQNSPQRSGPRHSIRTQILPPLVLAICLLQGTFVLTFFQHQKQQITEAKTAIAQRTQGQLREEMQRDVATMTAAMEAIIRDPQLAEALKSRDRAALLDRSRPLFERLKSQHQITHFYFHQPDRMNLVRLHKNLQGDLINRITLKRAEQTGRPSAGLEQGPTGNPVLRLVYPWRSDYPQRQDSNFFTGPQSGELLGYLELGIEFEDIASRISKLLQIDLIIAVDKTFLDQKQWEQRNQKLGRQSTWHTFPNHVIIDQSVTTIPSEVTQNLRANDFQNAIEIAQEGQTVQAIFLPFYDLDHRELGYVVILKDISNIVDAAQRSILIVSAINAAIALSLVWIFYVFLGRVEQDLAERTFKLEAAQTELAEYSQTLEHKVEARTLELQEKNQCLQQTLQELQRAQAQLVQNEKMSSLGQLVAGIAHEINNPVSFIYGNLKYARDYTTELLHLLQLYQQHYPKPVADIQTQVEDIDLNFLMEDLPKILSSMKVGAERIQSIVLSLRTFSRMDEAEFKAVNIHDGLDSTLMILQSRLKEQPNRPTIQITKAYGQLPPVECYAGQLNQVFMNILSNAIDALEEIWGTRQEVRGEMDNPPLPLTSHLLPTIHISTELTADDQVQIRIADNGPGIPPHLQSRLFDPFFTTKPIGRGTGMGLSISYQIVTEKHGGSLACFSEPGQGTEFIITIPLQQRSCARVGVSH